MERGLAWFLPKDNKINQQVTLKLINLLFTCYLLDVKHLEPACWALSSCIDFPRVPHGTSWMSAKT